MLGKAYVTVFPHLILFVLTNKVCLNDKVMFILHQFASELCAAAPCLNGGTCQSVKCVPKCHCVSGFSGGRCEIGQCFNINSKS